MGAMPVVVVHPRLEDTGSLLRVDMGACIGPLRASRFGQDARPKLCASRSTPACGPNV